ncbi:MAG: aldehyde dehydrogenase [Kiritimatiellia bacterium]
MSDPLTPLGMRSYFESGATRSPASRLDRLAGLDAAIVKFETELLDALKADLGKPAAEAYSSEIGFVRADIAHARRHLPQWTRPIRRRTPLLLQPAVSEIIPEPRGLALILSPWNYPFQLSFSPLTAALAAGNTVVLKPSEMAPRTAGVMRRLIASCFSPDCCTVLEGGPETAARLLEEPFDHIFFTGGTAVGRIVMQAAAKRLTPVTLELGGKSPAVVCADADIPAAARRLAWGKFMNAGQTCTAPDFVLADRRVFEPLLAALTRAITDFYGPDPGLSPDYGRIVNHRHFDRLTGCLGSGRVVCGGGHDRQSLYLAPTVLADVPEDAPAMRDELFGPILPVLPFESLEDALGGLRKRPHPLALYIFSASRNTQDRILAAVPSGGACVNDTLAHMMNPRLPFGGVGESGMGAYHGKTGFDTFSHWRSVMRRGTWWDPRLRYPPFQTPLKRLKRILPFMLE